MVDGVERRENDTAPTVEITEEQAIDKLHETGWLPAHDKEMTERPTVEQGYLTNCQNCKSDYSRGYEEGYKEGYKDGKKIARPQGEWLFKQCGCYICSECREVERAEKKFCSNCGAKMRKEDADNDEV